MVYFIVFDWDIVIYDSEDKVCIFLEFVEGEVEVEFDEFGFSFLVIIKDN